MSEQKPSHEVKGIVPRAERQDCVEAQICGKVAKHFCSVEGHQEHSGLHHYSMEEVELSQTGQTGEKGLGQEGEGQSTWNISRTLQVQSQKPSSAMMKLALMRTATGKEDPELPLLQRISSLELNGSHEDRHRNGRPRVPSAAEDKFISYHPQIGMEDPELPLLQRISSLVLPASDCSPNKCFTEFKYQTHLNINCSEETV
jgi:hypothetical protein